MPARSVVIEKLSKFTGEHHEFLTPGEYTQLTGRAGPARHRRASATRSCCWSPFVPFDQVAVAGVAPQRTRCTSSFRPTYNMAANLVRRYTTVRGPPPAQPLVRAVPRRPRRRDASSASSTAPSSRLARQRELVGRRRRRRRGVPRAGHRARDAAPQRSVGRSAHRRGAGGAPPRRRRRGPPPRRPRRRCSTTSTGAAAGSRLVAVTPGRDVVRLGPDDFDGPPRPRRHHRAPDAVRAPQPGVPRARPPSGCAG